MYFKVITIEILVRMLFTLIFFLSYIIKIIGGNHTEQKHSYIKVANKIVCRYPYSKTVNDVSIIGDVYSFKDKKWVTNPVTMGFKLSGDYIDLTQKEAHAFINERHQ